MRRLVLLLAFLCAANALPQGVAIPLPPAPTKYVTDAAGLIPDDRELALNERLAQHERTTTNQVIVYLDRALPQGTTLEEMGAQAIRTWGVGQKKLANGAILFLFIDSRDSRIEVGYGLEGVLTDAISKQILVDMRPLLRSGDYAGAVEQGAAAILATISGPAAATVQQQPAAKEPTSNSGADFSFLIPSALLMLMLVFFVFGIIRRARNRSQSFSGDSWSSSSSPSSSSDSSWSSSSSDSSWSSSSSDSSSSSSSDFSSGGGDGGGGGASDKW